MRIDHVLVVALLSSVCIGGRGGLAAPIVAKAGPRLGVIIIVDQLRAADVERLNPLFGDDGFSDWRALGGAAFDAYYAYAGTETAPGHATVVTGANPRRHAICANRAFRGGAFQYIVDDSRFPTFGVADEGRSPLSLGVGTLGDAWKAQYPNASRVVAVSLKDRSAILGGGRSADVAVWYDSRQGVFTTSSYYGAAPPLWLNEVNASLPKTFETATWVERELPASLSYLSVDDDQDGETLFDGWTRKFPHRLADAKTEELKKSLYRAMPISIADVFSLGRRALSEEKLGSDSSPDLLVLSVSTTDYVGHYYGPQSREMTDVLRTLDEEMSSFIRDVQRQVGVGNVAFAITGDHGSPPLPEQLSRNAGSRIVWPDLEAALSKSLVDNGFPRARVEIHPPHAYVVDSEAKPGTEAFQKAKRIIHDALLKTAGIAAVYDPTDSSSTWNTDDFGEFYRASYCPNSGGHLLFRTSPLVVFSPADGTGSDHSSPYTYDRRVPAIFIGPGIARGRYPRSIDVRDIAPSLAFIVGAAPPDGSEGRVVEAVIIERGSFFGR